MLTDIRFYWIILLVIAADLETLWIISGDFDTVMEMSHCLSRDAMLAIGQRHRYVELGGETRDVITRLKLHRRRGCRAGEHRRRRVHAARVVMSAVHCAALRQGIPTIIGNRVNNVNSDQLIERRLDRSVRVPVRTTVHRSSVRDANTTTNCTNITDGSGMPLALYHQVCTFLTLQPSRSLMPLTISLLIC